MLAVRERRWCKVTRVCLFRYTFRCLLFHMFLRGGVYFRWHVFI